jgi:hypothetical protein
VIPAGCAGSTSTADRREPGATSDVPRSTIQVPDGESTRGASATARILAASCRARSATGDGMDGRRQPSRVQVIVGEIQERALDAGSSTRLHRPRRGRRAPAIPPMRIPEPRELKPRARSGRHIGPHRAISDDCHTCLAPLPPQSPTRRAGRPQKREGPPSWRRFGRSWVCRPSHEVLPNECPPPFRPPLRCTPFP